ncbi:hypothetical protein F0U61_49925 [Archangium violaceum]|uniref:hypothetical protein n=1 Tax=Archangium violaceum TaxID=83451 RepID=UPI002B312E69|nr:hypothetical protein F0U61_49925 [Archangium violaceum]
MKWSTSLAAMLGLLLTLPLVWLLYIAMLKQSTGVPVAQPVPMLSHEERRSLLTYERDCDSNSDCEPPLQCFFSTRAMSRYCTDSRCVTDMQCPKGFVCRTQTTTTQGDPLRVCALVGERKEGEVCMAHSSTRDYACAEGLLCHARCGRPCKLDDPASCPEGFFCHEGSEDGPLCQPTCEGRSCPEGQQCVVRRPSPQGRQVSLCAKVYGQDCRQNPCPEGQFCRFYESPKHAETVWMECVPICDENTPSCPEGSVCHLSQCLQACTPENPSSCEPGFACHRKTAQEPWRCEPIPRASSQPSP